MARSAGALGTAMTAGADQTFRDLVREAIGRRDAIGAWLMRTGGVDEAVAALSGTLGIAPHDTIDSVEAEFFAGSLIASSEWSAIAAALGQGSKSDCEQARRFGALAALSGSERVETYLDIFCTDQGTPRQTDRYQGDQGSPRWSNGCAPSGRASMPSSAGAMPSSAVTAARRCSPSPSRCWRATTTKRSGAVSSTTTI